VLERLFAPLVVALTRIDEGDQRSGVGQRRDFNVL